MEAGTRDELERVALLYRGDLLEGVSVGEPSFEEWLLTERERLRELALDALARLLAAQMKAPTDERAIQTALRLLALDPLQEVVHRTLIRLYARRGRRAAALRQYQQCVEVLQRELGAAPEPETRALYQSLVRKQPLEPPADEIAVPDAPPSPAARPIGLEDRESDPPLIGRRPEMARLRQALDEVAAGRSRVVAIVGEAGIGKTRLLREAVATVAERDGRALLGRCYESEQILPFGPWVDALRAGQVGADADLIEGLDQAWRVELARLLPELGERGARVPADSPDHLRLFEAVAQVVIELGKRGLLLIVLEDVHWADEMSLRLVAFLGRRLEACPVLLVVTARAEELADAAGLRRTLDALGRTPSFTSLTLAPLSESDTLRLARSLARSGSEESAVTELADQVWASSAGNPFVAVETLRALREGAIRPGPGTLAPRVRDVIAARLDRLGDSSRDVVAVAAVIGRDFEFEVLREATGLDHDQVSAVVEELVRHRVLQGVGERFDFSHDRIAEVARGGLLPPRLKLLHRRIAEAIEAHYRANLEPHWGALAVHYREGEVWPRAVQYLTRLAEKAARQYAHADALAALEQAFGHIDGLPAEERDVAALNLVFRQARCLSALGRFAESLERLLQQQERLERLRDPRLIGTCEFLLANTFVYLGDQDRADQHARRAIEAAERAGDPATMGKAYYVLAFGDFWRAQPLAGLKDARESVALLEKTGESWWLGPAYWVLGGAHYLLGDIKAAMDTSRRISEIARAAGHDPRLEILAAWGMGFLAANAAEWDVAVREGQRGLELAYDPYNTCVTRGFLGWTYAMKEDPDRAIPLLEQAILESRRFRLRQHECWFSTALSEAYLAQRRLDRAREVATATLAAAAEIKYWQGLGAAQRALGRIALAEGALTEAETQLNEALRTFAAIPARLEIARCHQALARLARARGDGEATARHLGAADTLFQALDLPRHVERTRQLAVELGAPLA